MKKVYGYFILLLCSLVIFTACDEKKTIDNTDYAELLVGVFKGEMTYTSGEKVQTKTYLQKGSTINQLDVTVADYRISPTEVVDIVVKNATVTKIADNTISFEGTNGTAVTKEGTKTIAIKGHSDAKASEVNVEVIVDGMSAASVKGVPYAEKGEAVMKSATIEGVCVLSSGLDVAASTFNYSVPTHAREADLKAIKLDVVVAEGATWVVKEGSAIDFTKDEFTLVVKSEDAKTSKEYIFKKTKVGVEDSSAMLVSVYNGDMIVSLNGSPTPAVKQFVTITNKELETENMVELSIRNFAFSGMVIGDIMVEEVAIYKHDDIYKLSGYSKVAFNIAGQNIEAGVYVTGELNATGKLILSIDVQNVEGLVILVTYSGEKSGDGSATEPASVTITGSDKMFAGTFKKGNYEYYARKSTPVSEFENLNVEIVLPPGATMRFFDESGADYTKSVVYYDVFPADGGKSKRYSISRKPIESVNETSFSFTDWKITEETEQASAYEDPIGWQTPNSGVMMIKAFGVDLYPKDGQYATQKEPNGKVGSAVKMVTLDTKGGLIFGMVESPKVTAGNIFTGTFNAFAAMEDRMLTTEFGLPYDGDKVTGLKGWYKYAPGETYFDVLEDKGNSVVDQASISVVLYDVTEDPNFTLTGKDIYSSTKIVAQGGINPMSVAEFTEFSVDLTYYQEYTPVTKLYKLAIIMSSSKDGDKFKGAPGSTLVVDEVMLQTTR